MNIQSIYDPSFREYGCVVPGDFREMVEALKKVPCPAEGTTYVASVKELEATRDFLVLQAAHYGHLPVQAGYCSGHNKVLTCLEYHKSSEINLAPQDFVLLIGKRKDIENGSYDLSKVEAFLVPAGVAVEIYATTLHYAPCSVKGDGFQMLVILPKGTNVGDVREEKDPLLFSCNKWLLAHEDAPEAKLGAKVGLIGAMPKID